MFSTQRGGAIGHHPSGQPEPQRNLGGLGRRWQSRDVGDRGGLAPPSPTPTAAAVGARSCAAAADAYGSGGRGVPSQPSGTDKDVAKVL